MTLQVILKSGAGFTTECEDITMRIDSGGNLCEWTIKGSKEHIPIYTDLAEVAAVIRLDS